METITFEPQQRLVDRAVDTYQRVAGSGRGRLSFIAGASGSGRKTTLRRIGERLAYEEPPPLVVGGSMAGVGFRAWSGELAEERQLVGSLEKVAGERDKLEKAAGLVGGAAVLHPYLGLLAAFVSVASVAIKLRDRLLKGQLAGLEQAEIPQLLLHLLREEADKQPVVLLLEDVDQAADLWLTGFLDSMARELPVDLPALVMVSVEGPAEPGPHVAEEPTLMRIARREVKDRQRADWWWLSPLTRSDLKGWLGSANSRVVHELFELAGGNLALVAGLWEVWGDQKLVSRPASDAAWEFTPGFEERAARSLKDVVEARLRTLVAGDGAAFDRLWDALQLGALEGRAFTADAVARALDPPREPDDLIDELDDRIATDDERETGLVQELSAIRGSSSSRALWRYEFASELQWRVMRHYVGSEELSNLSGRLADTLVEVYDWDPSLISRTVAKLYEQAGENHLAARYHALADFRASAEARMVQGRVLLGMPTQGWDRLDFIAFAIDLNNLASLLHDQGELAAARPLYERALAIREWVLGPDHPDTAGSLNNLARLLQDQGELAAARPLYERALAIRERMLGPDHPDTAGSLNNLASLLQDQGELAAARPLHERALAIRERMLGPDHPHTAGSLNNLAALLRDQGELAAARPLYERALAIWERVLGQDHRDTASGLNNLATLFQDQGELAAARPLYERALEIRERVLGQDHPYTASSLTNLAGVLRAQGELASARPLYKRALAIRERVLGPEHPDTAISLRNLASLLQDQGEPAAARPLYERALAIVEQVLGPEHPYTQTLSNRVASLSTVRRFPEVR